MVYRFCSLFSIYGFWEGLIGAGTGIYLFKSLPMWLSNLRKFVVSCGVGVMVFE